MADRRALAFEGKFHAVRSLVEGIKRRSVDVSNRPLRHRLAIMWFS